MNTPTALLLAALLSIFRPPGRVRSRIDAHQAQIAADADAASAATGADPAILMFVALAETHLGQDAGEGGGWGAPTDRFHRHTAGTAFHSARALAWSYRVCGGSWLRAVRRYRTGACGVEPRRGYTARRALQIAVRMYERAGLAVPDGLRSSR